MVGLEFCGHRDNIENRIHHITFLFDSVPGLPDRGPTTAISVSVDTETFCTFPDFDVDNVPVVQFEAGIYHIRFSGANSGSLQDYKSGSETLRVSGDPVGGVDTVLNSGVEVEHFNHPFQMIRGLGAVPFACTSIKA